MMGRAAAWERGADGPAGRERGGRRIALFGGTFDPIHVGHLFVANAIAAEAGLERVLFVPVGDPAHRPTHAPASDRAAMVKTAIAGNERFAFDDTALRQPGPVYTADTMPLLRAAHPDADFSFIAGIDSLVASPWRRLDEVVRALARFFVIAREGAQEQALDATLGTLPADLAQRFLFVRLPLVDVSSTAIRERVAKNAPIRYLVPDAVERYVEEKGLYRTRG
jgi:nicotinate-nucleotide adenylyltransferase